MLNSPYKLDGKGGNSMTVRPVKNDPNTIQKVYKLQYEIDRISKVRTARASSRKVESSIENRTSDVEQFSKTINNMRPNRY